MGYYVIGAFGRATCMALLAGVLIFGGDWSASVLITAVMVLWTAYAFVSGIVAVPYNDIVARAVPSDLRSRLLAARFFGGGVLALGVVALADRLVGNLAFPMSYGVIIAMAAVLMFISSGVFSAMGEPEAAAKITAKPGFLRYLKDGIAVFRKNRVFRCFVYAQWCGGAVLMAMPFYVVQASGLGFDLGRIALLLGAQTLGALLSNLLWGWWGDALGKLSLLRAIALGRVLPPLVMLGMGLAWNGGSGSLLVIFLAVFFVLGALANGLTIAVIGFLMEISPDDQRPAFSGYFNAITAPAFLLPLVAGGIASLFGLAVVFGLSLAAAIAQFLLLRGLKRQASS